MKLILYCCIMIATITVVHNISYAYVTEQERQSSKALCEDNPELLGCNDKYYE